MAADVELQKFSSSKQSIPGLSSKKNHHGKLLRKPRAPKVQQLEPPESQPVENGHIKPINIFSDYAEEQSMRDYGPPTALPSGAPSLVSPPPPSEAHLHPDGIYRQGPWPSHQNSRPTQPMRRTALRREDLKYVLDPMYRERTCLGTYVEGQTLVKPYKPRGPDGLPPRPPRQNPPILNVFFDEDFYDQYEPPEFTLNDFMLEVSNIGNVPIRRVHEVMISRHNYKKLQKLLADQFLHTNPTVSVVEMEPSDYGFPKVTPRIPQRQLLLEMAALVKEQMSGAMNIDMKSFIRPLPRYSPNYKPGQPAPHTEIVLYEEGSADRSTKISTFRDNEAPKRDSIFHASTARYFQGSRRSNSPFAMGDDVISPSELAVLDSLVSGGTALSLKAHFISQLPDIEPLSKTVVYLNLSFNDFTAVPQEVFQISQLRTLKLRNNPLLELPADIGKLKHLRTLVCSFCLISTLPPALFTLTKLEFLDFAYNKVSFIPNEIKHLKNLREMNAEGNQLAAMPKGCLQLQALKVLVVRNNYMHPLFWAESTKNNPQRLGDLASTALRQCDEYKLMTNIPEHVRQHLDNAEKCDTCRGPMFGPGLRLIRPVHKMFGVKNLPILFRCCSPYCLELFKENMDNLDLIYGED